MFDHLIIDPVAPSKEPYVTKYALERLRRGEEARVIDSVGQTSTIDSDVDLHVVIAPRRPVSRGRRSKKRSRCSRICPPTYTTYPM
jgi:hypothetical protein